MDELKFIALGLVVLLAAAVIRPTRARCPAGFFVEGVRPSGTTQCLPVGPPSPSCAGAVICPDTPGPAHGIPIQIYCTGGSIPIVVDGRTVGCTMRGA